MTYKCTFLLAATMAIHALAPAPANAQYTRWYLAEGATTSFFEDEILVANPNASSVTLTLTFLPENGASSQQNVTVAATSRTTIRLNDYVPNDAVSVIVDAPSNVLVERSMYWPGSSRRGGHHANGVTTAQTRWYFAEGSTNIFQDFLLVANPSSSTTAEITITFLRDNGQPAITLNRTVAPLKRDTVWVNSFVSALAGESFAAVVESTNAVPVLAERAMYWSDFEGGHGATGVASASTTWRFAEGYTGGTFQTFLLLQNPGGSTANVTVTFYPENGTPIPYNLSVAAGKRETVWVNALPFDPDGSFSMVVQSDQNIVAERAMYWGNFVDGHDSQGSDTEATAWGFAEGLEDGHGGPEYDTFYLFVNASNTAANIQATFYREDGTGIVRTFTIPAQQRYTLIPAQYPELTFQKFSAFFTSTNAVPFVAERAVYWGGDYYGGHASLGTPWTGTIATPPAVGAMTASGISPTAGSANGGTDVTVTGNNFTRNTTVTFDGIAASNVRVLTDSSLTLTTPAHAAGAVNVVVSNELGSATLTNAYTYETPPPPPPPPSNPNSIDLSKVNWLHRNISGWAQTSTITGVDITGDQICVYHTKAGQWPRSELGDVDPIEVEGNVWIVAFVNNAWWAATYDWLRPGQECKFVTGPELGVDQIRIPPLDASWQPKSGDTVGFIVSTRARDSLNAGQERTNVWTMKWP